VPGLILVLSHAFEPVLRSKKYSTLQNNDHLANQGMPMKKRSVILAIVVTAVAASVLVKNEQNKRVFAAQNVAEAKSSSCGTTAQFTADGKLKLPVGFRRWVFLGAPLTPNALNDGEASFPEFHHVYVEEKNLDAYLKTGSFPDGTILIKELTRVLKPTYPDGSRTEPSGRGYFNGELNGIDASVKDSKRFAKTNGWGYFTFGHHPMPYAQTAAESPVSECAGCHLANVAKTDMTWVQFYPILRDKPRP
jgi:hypothetical protein